MKIAVSKFFAILAMGVFVVATTAFSAYVMCHLGGSIEAQRMTGLFMGCVAIASLIPIANCMAGGKLNLWILGK